MALYRTQNAVTGVPLPVQELSMPVTRQWLPIQGRCQQGGSAYLCARLRRTEEAMQEALATERVEILADAKKTAGDQIQAALEDSNTTMLEKARKK